jgi:TetR/AcrR family transcriptional regulator
MGRNFLSSKRIQGGAKKTPTAVLRAAERVFAKQGFAGTSMRDISRASGVSQPLIHHYFKTKRDLYNEIKRQMILRFDAFWTDTVRGLTENECVPGSVLRRIFEFMKENPTVLRVGAWSQLEGDSAPWPGELQALERVSGVFSAAQADGRMRPNLNATLLAILVEGFMFSWWEYRENYVRLYEGMPESENLDEKVLEVMTEVFLHGTLTKSSPRPGRSKSNSIPAARESLARSVESEHKNPRT